MKLNVRKLGIIKIEDAIDKLEEFKKLPKKQNEIWVTEHERAFTEGLDGVGEVTRDGTPIIKTNRRGCVTHFAPGQISCYMNLNMRDLIKSNIDPMSMERLIEKSVVDTLNHFGMYDVFLEPTAPGVYYDNKKISALGLSIDNMWTSWGFSLNVTNENDGFEVIHPCGYIGMKSARMSDYVEGITVEQVTPILIENFAKAFNFDIELETTSWDFE